MFLCQAEDGIRVLVRSRGLGDGYKRQLPWNEVFWITGAFMIPGMVMAWLVSEPQIRGTPKTLRQAVTEPFHEFIGRQGWRGAMMVLGFIFLYKLGDSLCTCLLYTSDAADERSMVDLGGPTYI